MALTNSVIIQKATAWNDYLIETRTYLHEHPELSCEEIETVKFLKQELSELDVQIEDVPASTGFTALLDTGRPGKTLGIRTDIDALPIEEHEENLVGKRNCLSKNKGIMHACGHDGHMAIVLTTAKILSEIKEHLTGKVYFIFEEGEEIGAGIDAMIAHLQDKNIDHIYGNHLAAFLESDKVSLDAGPKMAGASFVDFTVHGKGGHGARPDLATNPIFAAAHILTGIESAWANQINIHKTVTLGLTQIHAGSANNVIPDDATIGGSLRFYDVAEGKRALEIVKKVATSTAEAHNCRVTFNDGLSVDPVMNDEHLAKIAEKGAEEIMPGSTVKDVRWFASEPFSRYAEIAPTLFGFIGIKNEAYGSGADHHNHRFDIDVNALINGVLTTTKFAVDYLRKK